MGKKPAKDSAKKQGDPLLEAAEGKKSAKRRSGRRGDPVSLYPLSMDQAVDAIFAIKPDDVKKILASKPGKKK